MNKIEIALLEKVLTASLNIDDEEFLLSSDGNDDFNPMLMATSPVSRGSK